MCTVSMVGDYGQKMWPPPNFIPQQPYNPPPITFPLPSPAYNGPTREQFEEFLILLRAAKKFDEATGQPHCEQDEKLAWIKSIAAHLGVPEPKL